MSFSKNTLLPPVPENAIGQPSAVSFEQQSAAHKNTTEGFEEVAHGVKKQRQHVAHTRARLAFTLGLHLAGFGIQICVLAAFIIDAHVHFIGAVLAVIVANACICTWVAWSDAEVTFLASWGCARLPLLFLVYGLLQYIHIKHIVGLYRRRRDSGTDGPAQKEFHPKTFDGILEGIPLAWICIWSFALMGGEEGNSCSWYLPVDPGRPDFRYLYLAAGWMSMITVAMGILEIDYRVSDSARDAIDGSLKGTFFQWSYRFTEAGQRICGVVLLCMIFEPIIQKKAPGYALLIMPCYPLFWMGVYYIILSSSRPKNAKREHFLAHGVVAFCIWFINPVRFVDSPTYVVVARRINRCIASARLAEYGIMLVLFALVFVLHGAFPENCWESDDLENPHFEKEVIIHIFKNNKILISSWVLMIFLHAVICFFGPPTFQLTKIFSGDQVLTDDTVLEMIPAAQVNDGEFSSASVAVRQTKARGISSHLLKIGTGVTSQMFAKEEQAFGDFIIEKVLGTGTFGVVVLVRMRGNKSSGSQSMDGTQDNVVYAMKMQNTEAKAQRGINTTTLPGAGAFRGVTAERESAILTKLNHPFIIRLAYFFEVPDRALKDAQTGNIIKDNNNNHRFHKAIVMEYCPGGDLDQYVCKNALPPHHVQDAVLSADGVVWLQRCRRFTGEMCVALAFLHENEIVYRDLKPQNVLLKSGLDDDLHICLTDFGLAKDVSDVMGGCNSLAGSPFYVAPEIQEISAKQMRIEYTEQVDLFSLGKTMCVMLYRTKLREDPADLLELDTPSVAECKGDARIPASAWELIDKLTATKPALRGSLSSVGPAGRGMGDIQRHAFFKEINLETAVLPPLKLGSLEKYAC